ncbi:MAG: hypothetical protein QXN87_04910 [Candidatus Bathyarchaeia archaeon]
MSKALSMGVCRRFPPLKALLLCGRLQLRVYAARLQGFRNEEF